MSEGNFLAGEIVVDSVTIVNPEKESIDITNLTGSINIFEGIDSFFVSGRLSIVDSLNVLDEYKLHGQESVTIRYRVKRGTTDFSGGAESIEKTFRIYKVDKIKNYQFTTYSYILNFIDPKFFTCKRTRVSRVKRGSYSEILLQTLQNDAQFDQLPTADQTDFWEESVPSNYQFVCPNWTVEELIKYCSKNANVSADAVYKNGMFFYGTLVGGYKFMSIDKMLKDLEFPLKFSFMGRSEEINQEQRHQDDERGLSTKIISYEIDKRANVGAGIKRGAYSSTLKSYDPIRKLEKTITFDLKKNFEEKGKKHLSGFPQVRLGINEETRKAEPITNIDEPIVFNETISDVPLNEDYLIGGVIHDKVNQTNAFSDSAILQDQSQFIGNEFLDNAILEREALKHALDTNVIYVTIPARTDIFPGVVVNLSLPSGGVDKFDNILNDGKYLITQIHHSLSPLDSQGTMAMRCVKESFADKFENQQLLKEYKGARRRESPSQPVQKNE
tara:strand:- start:20034 stop:21533 length:1500 start_codon:yes stop_codon:yes gene_type:complete